MSATACDSTTIELARSYLEILQGSDLASVFRESTELSGLFLPGVPANFAQAKHRILVVGMETKAWRDGSCPFKRLSVPTLEAVVESMDVQRRCLAQPAGRHGFLRFVERVRKVARDRIPDEETGVLWGNLFCVSHAGRTPTKSSTFAQIQALSSQLLRAQIAVTDPDVILFTTGVSYDAFLRECFPDRADSVAIERRCLWRFRVGRALCFRTSHPRYVAHTRWRSQALDLACRHMIAGGVHPELPA